jgi:hypothetical protein
MAHNAWKSSGTTIAVYDTGKLNFTPAPQPVVRQLIDQHFVDWINPLTQPNM